MTGNKCLSLGLVLYLLAPLQVVAETTVFFLYDGANLQHRSYVFDSEMVLHNLMPQVKTVQLSLSKAEELSTIPHNRSLVISVGSSAARLASESGLPTLNTLITRRNFESIKGAYNAPVTAIYLEQPFSRMLSLVKTTLPDRDELTILLGPTSKQMQKDIKQGCLEHKVSCKTVVAEDQAGIEEGLQLAAGRGGVMLVLPDPQIVNASTARNLILGAYRRGVALVGYSRALVKAGALMAVHSTPEQLGEDASLMVIKTLKGDTLKLPPSRYPEIFSVSVNYQLARALGLDLAPESVLTKAIGKAERDE